MLRYIYTKYSKRHLSKWTVLIFDVINSMFMFVCAFIIRHNFSSLGIWEYPLLNYTINVGIITLLISFWNKSYVGIIRKTSVHDLVKVFWSCFIVSFILFLLVVLGTRYEIDIARMGRIPLGVIAIHFLLSFFVLSFGRIFVKIIYESVRYDKQKHENVLIYGAGETGQLTMVSLKNNPTVNFHIVGFVDVHHAKVGKTIAGVSVFELEDIDADFMHKYKVEEIIVASPDISHRKLQELTDFFLRHGVIVKRVPPLDKWLNGELDIRQIKKINIEDLLNRNTIQLDDVHVRKDIRYKRILVTGAAGSIGSEIVKQILKFHPREVLLIDQSETGLYDLQNDLKHLNTEEIPVILRIVDISNLPVLKRTFSEFKPEIVYHAAAYKHVPLMEENPLEALRVNVFGTANLTQLALNNEVEKFVMVSTDKAVNPTNIMGASKRMAEIYTQSYNSLYKTKFITTRFGNVLGSNGSVIPLFKKQIEQGGPLTVTHKEITRYFMTIPEACQLVLEAGAMGKGGEIFVFDMGESVKIYDLAQRMIRLSGYELDEIEIKITGLRPGEKLYEELLAEEEDSVGTYHPRIMIGKVREYGLDDIEDKMTRLRKVYNAGDIYENVALLKSYIPEYQSENSPFEELDEQIGNKKA